MHTMSSWTILINLMAYIKVFMWSSAGYISLGLNFRIHFSGLLGKKICFPGTKTTSRFNQGLFTWSAIGASSTEEELEYYSLYEES